jgi:2-keto-4-pentenoate hydratase/2-oxohepta-3-ene-1,7-dioic acid hydratase in catechol pathway
MKIICVGRNYAQHAHELGNEVPKEPVLFIKPETSLILPKNPMLIPWFTRDLHHEIEVVIRIGRNGKHIQPQFAHRYVNGIGLGLDMTARDVQDECKKKGLPWEKAKAFDGSALVSPFVNPDELEWDNISFSLEKNGENVQSGNTNEMIFNIPQIIHHISTYFMLKIGDYIFTGTPAGVGPVQVNDQLKGFMNGKEMFSIRVK